jgi:hypothetical protein
MPILEIRNERFLRLIKKSFEMSIHQLKATLNLGNNYAIVLFKIEKSCLIKWIQLKIVPTVKN